MGSVVVREGLREGGDCSLLLIMLLLPPADRGWWRSALLGVEDGVGSVILEGWGVIFSLFSSHLEGGGREGFKDFSLLLLPLHHVGGGRGRLVLLGSVGSIFFASLCWLVDWVGGCEGGGGGVDLLLLFSCLGGSTFGAAASAPLWSLEGLSSPLHGTSPWQVSVLRPYGCLCRAASPPPTNWWGRGCSLSW